MSSLNRTARFWIEGDLRGWDFAAKQSRRAFNGAIHAYDLGKGMTIAGQFAREWAPWLHSQITRAVATLVARPTWRSYLALGQPGALASGEPVDAEFEAEGTATAEQDGQDGRQEEDGEDAATADRRERGEGAESAENGKGQTGTAESGNPGITENGDL